MQDNFFEFFKPNIYVNGPMAMLNIALFGDVFLNPSPSKYDRKLLPKIAFPLITAATHAASFACFAVPHVVPPNAFIIAALGYTVLWFQKIKLYGQELLHLLTHPECSLRWCVDIVSDLVGMCVVTAISGTHILHHSVNFEMQSNYISESGRVPFCQVIFKRLQS